MMEISSAFELIGVAFGGFDIDKVIARARAKKSQFVAMDESGDVFTHCVNPFHSNQDHNIVMTTISGRWDSDFGTIGIYVGVVPEEMRGNWKTMCYSLEDLLK